jgi:hypothetical protein
MGRPKMCCESVKTVGVNLELGGSLEVHALNGLA